MSLNSFWDQHPINLNSLNHSFVFGSFLARFQRGEAEIQGHQRFLYPGAPLPDLLFQ